MIDSRTLNPPRLSFQGKMYTQKEGPTLSCAPKWQFVSVSGPKSTGTSKQIRTQVMHDYIWKLKNKDVTRSNVIVPSVELGKPAKSRFRLDPSVGGHQEEEVKRKKELNKSKDIGKKLKKARSPPVVGFGLQMEVFDTFNHHLRPFSKMTLHYCK